MSCDITTNGFAQTTGYVVGPGGEQLTEVDANNNWRHTNIYAGGKLIGTYDGTVSAPTLHYYFDDPLGTRRAQANSAGVLEAVYVSLPFGDGYAANTADDPTENHFTGKERDVESGNDYFLARYYGSSTGRFLSPDPSGLYYADPGDPQSLNLYEYVMNNPLTMIDPDGLRQVCGKQTSSPDGNGVKVYANCYDVPDPNINEIVNTTLLRMDWNNERIGMQFAKKIKKPSPNTAARTAPNSGRQVPLVLCAAQAADKLSLANAMGTSGKPGFWNGVANGFFGNTISTVVEYAYGGSNAELGAAAYDYGTQASESTVNAATGSAGLTDLGLAAESASQVAAESAEEGLGGPVAILKGAYDLATFAYGIGHCVP